MFGHQNRRLRGLGLLLLVGFAVGVVLVVGGSVAAQPAPEGADQGLAADNAMTPVGVDALRRTHTRTPTTITSPYDWLQFGGNPQHSLNNTLETSINATNVSGLHLLFQVHLPAKVDTTPVYLSGVSTQSGVRDLLYLLTPDGHLIAFDAHTGARIWSVRHAYPGTCTFGDGKACFTASAPAIDPNRNYIYTYGLDGFAHKHNVGDGSEITTGGWPELITAKPSQDKGSASVSIATAQNGTSYLYVGTASQGDLGDYQGHLTTIDLATGSQHVFNLVCSDQTDIHFVQAPGSPDCSRTLNGIWGRAGFLYVPDLDRIALASANGPFTPLSHDWGDSTLELNPDGTGLLGDPLDSYTPVDQLTLAQKDKDLGSVAPVLLPVPANSVVQHLALQTGKDANLRLLNLDNLSGQGGIGHTGGEVAPVIPLPQGPAPVYHTAVRSAPAVWVNPADQSTWIFITNPNGLTGLHLIVDNSGHPSLQVIWHNSCTCALPAGNSPLVANGLLFIANSRNIQALDPLTGSQLWHQTTIGTIHWSSPIVVNGVLYISDTSNHLTAFSLH